MHHLETRRLLNHGIQIREHRDRNEHHGHDVRAIKKTGDRKIRITNAATADVMIATKLPSPSERVQHKIGTFSANRAREEQTEEEKTVEESDESEDALEEQTEEGVEEEEDSAEEQTEKGRIEREEDVAEEEAQEDGNVAEEQAQEDEEIAEEQANNEVEEKQIDLLTMPLPQQQEQQQQLQHKQQQQQQHKQLQQQQQQQLIATESAADAAFEAAAMAAAAASMALCTAPDRIPLLDYTDDPDVTEVWLDSEMPGLRFEEGGKIVVSKVDIEGEAEEKGVLVGSEVLAVMGVRPTHVADIYKILRDTDGPAHIQMLQAGRPSKSCTYPGGRILQ